MYYYNEDDDRLFRAQIAANELTREKDKVIADLQDKLEYTRNLIPKSKAEAVKAFAERLKDKAKFVGIDREGDFLDSEFDEYKIYFSVAEVIEHLSEIVIKEMTGAEDDGNTEKDS